MVTTRFHFCQKRNNDKGFINTFQFSFSLEGMMKKLFKLLPLALSLCFMAGCQNKAAMAELEQFKAQAAIEQENVAVFRQFHEAVDSRDIERFISFLAIRLI